MTMLFMKELLGAGLITAGLLTCVSGAKKIVRLLRAFDQKMEAIDAVNAAFERGEMSPKMRERWLDTIQENWERGREPAPIDKLTARVKRIIKK